jgi:hypothetical protein
MIYIIIYWCCLKDVLYIVQETSNVWVCRTSSHNLGGVTILVAQSGPHSLFLFRHATDTWWITKLSLQLHSCCSWPSCLFPKPLYKLWYWLTVLFFIFEWGLDRPLVTIILKNVTLDSWTARVTVIWCSARKVYVKSCVMRFEFNMTT